MDGEEDGCACADLRACRVFLICVPASVARCASAGASPRPEADADAGPAAPQAPP